MTKLLNKKGFTLIELMVVIVIVGILAAVAIPKFTMASHKAKASEFPTVLMSIFTAEGTFEQETGNYSSAAVGVAAGWANLGLDDPTSASKWFEYDVTGTVVSGLEISDFTATATVTTGFGDAEVGDYATINQAQTKNCDQADGLPIYARNWED